MVVAVAGPGPPKIDDEVLSQASVNRFETVQCANIMRIGEIAIVGPGTRFKHEFIKAVCDEIVVQTEEFIFGRLKINSQLVVHLYGLDYSDKEIKPSWDLVSKKLLGYVVLFDWDNPDSHPKVKEIVDSLTSRYNIPVVLAANVQNSIKQIPVQLLNVDFSISECSEFTFCKISDPESAKNVLVILLNSVIEKLN